jgi:hypothetical protein
MARRPQALHREQGQQSNLPRQRLPLDCPGRSIHHHLPPSPEAARRRH